MHRGDRLGCVDASPLSRAGDPLACWWPVFVAGGKTESMRDWMRWTKVLGATCVLAACGQPDEREETGAGPGIGSVSMSMSAGEGTASGSEGGSEGVGTEGMSASGDDSTGTPVGPKFDLGVQPDAGPPVEEGCTKVDFLFVIDNSGSMADEQDNLTASFPGFISGIQGSLEQVDEYQVGVVTTDAYGPNDASPGCGVLGGLVVQTGGSDSSSSVCGPYAGGTNFMTEADDLNTAFACAADVGTAGDGCERPMDAMGNVLNKVHGGPGACNEGYLRDDALLVIVIITDEYDGAGDPEGCASGGDPASWYATVVASKLGIPENAVALGLLNYAGGQCPPADSVYDGGNIVNFVSMFGPNGFLGGICEPDYGPVFADAVGIIEEACNNFTPPG
jgi:hypothetical protein